MSKNWIRRLDQRLHEWARSFSSDTSGRLSRTVRTEVTVRREAMALLVGDPAAAGFDVCPLCGTGLAPAQAEQVSGRLLKGSISQVQQDGIEK
jgi:hypothetical protein